MENKTEPKEKCSKGGFALLYNPGAPQADLKIGMESPNQESLEAQPKPPSEPSNDSHPHLQSFSGLRREHQQCQRDIQNLPFPSSPKTPSRTVYPLREVPSGDGNFGFVNALLTSSEV